MTDARSVLDKAHADAQQVHQNISGNIDRAKAATWADVKAVQADVQALANRMKTATTDQADAIKAAMHSAIGKLEDAAKLVEDKAIVGKDSVKHANQAMLDGAHKAAQSLSDAVNALRTKAATAIAPKPADDKSHAPQ